jgi:two-component system response regulator DegU
MNEISVLLADDHPVVREGLKKLLEEANINVVGEAGDGSEVLMLANELQPDVVLLDIEMPGINGIEAARELRKVNPNANIVMLTMHDEKDYLFKAIKAGAVGYVLKDRAPEELVQTLIDASKGLSRLDPNLATEILREFSEIETRKDEEFRLFSSLTAREREILKYLAQARSNKEIAKELYISDKTVRNHLRNIFEKLHINDRTAAAVLAVRKGLA